MATIDTTVRNTAVDAIAALFNNGDVMFQTSASSEVATVGFPATAFGAASNGTATAGTMEDDTSAAGGTVDHAHMRTSGATERITLTCGVTGSGEDIELTSLSIGAGDTVSITSLTMTMPDGS